MTQLELKHPPNFREVPVPDSCPVCIYVGSHYCNCCGSTYICSQYTEEYNGKIRNKNVEELDICDTFERDESK